MGSQEHKTKVVPDTLSPVWDASMQFTVKDLEQDVLCITVYDRDLFSPNGTKHFYLKKRTIFLLEINELLYQFLLFLLSSFKDEIPTRARL